MFFSRCSATIFDNIEDNDGTPYKDKLRFLTDVELVDLAGKASLDLLFFLIQMKDAKNSLRESPKRLAEAESTVSELRNSLAAVRLEFERRDKVMYRDLIINSHRKPSLSIKSTEEVNGV